MKIIIGKTYYALLNDVVRTFAVEEYDPSKDWFGVVWDDGDSEWLYREDIERMEEDYLYREKGE